MHPPSAELKSEEQQAPDSEASCCPAPHARFLQGWRLAAVGWAVACLILQSFALTNRSFEPDEGMRVYCARELLQGQTPYEDFWDHKDPMEWLLCAFLLNVFGNSISGLRLGVVLLRAILMYQLIGLARQLQITRHLWLVGALSLILLTAEPIQGNTAAMEIPGLLFFVVAMRFGLTAIAKPNPKRLLYSLIAGILAGLGMLVKLTTAVSCLVPFVLLWLLRPRTRENSQEYGLVPQLSLVAVGVLIPIAAVAMWCIQNGILDNWLFVLTVYNPAYSQGVPHWEYLSGVLPSRLAFLAPFAALAVLGILRNWRNQRLAMLWLAVWLLLSVVSVCLGWRFYPHYFLLLVPPMALSGAASLDTLKARTPAASFLNALTVSLLLVGALLGVNVVKWYLLEAPHWKPPNMGFFTDESVVQLAEYVRDTTEPQETIYVLGYCPDIYVLSERSSASRYVFKMPLAAEHSPIRREAKQEVVHTLKADPPRYFIVMKKDWTPQHPQNSDEFLKQWRPMAELVEKNYTLFESRELYDLYVFQEPVVRINPAVLRFAIREETHG